MAENQPEKQSPAAHLSKFQWRPGQTGNPNGRPRKRPQSEANAELLARKLPEDVRRSMNYVTINGSKRPCELLKPGATFADSISIALWQKSLRGNSMAAKELRESVEGKSTQRIELSRGGDDRAPRFIVEYRQPIAETEESKKHRELIEKQYPHVIDVEPTNNAPQSPQNDEPPAPDKQP